MDYLIMVIITFGALFVLFAAIGIVRMPDLYLRLSVTTKAATLGVGMILISGAVYFSEPSMTTRALAVVFFLLLNAPVGAHLIGKASYFAGIPLWKKTVLDDIKGSKDDYSALKNGEDEDRNKNTDTESQKPEADV